MKTIDEFDISELMRIINYQMTENQQLKNELSELKVKYKQLLEENRVLKIEKNRLFQERNNLKCLKKQNEELKTDKKYRLEEIQNLNNKIKILTSITDKTNKYKQALEEIQNVLFPKNKLLITDYKGLLKTQEILNEVLKDE